MPSPDLTEAEVKEMRALLRSKPNVMQILRIMALYDLFDTQKDNPELDRPRLERLRVIMRNPTGEKRK
jgi:hypothetical protein